MTPADYARCRGRDSTPAECASCRRWHAAAETLANARVPSEIFRVAWLTTPIATPCPMREELPHG